MQIEASLPSERVVPSAPFTIIGIDFAGSVHIRCLKPRDTTYIALFTCATTRVLHIELVSDLTTYKFLLALQRFVGRRGLPNTIYTDNATNFHAENKELILFWQTLSSAITQQYYAQNGITWRFIAIRVAWGGRLVERLICIVKQCLRKVLEGVNEDSGQTFLDEESLSTIFIGIEAALNSRPLVYEEENDDNSSTLTPAHFLTGRKLTAIPSRLKNARLIKSISSSRTYSTAFGKNGRKNIFFNYDPSIKFETRTVPLTSEMEILCFCKKTSDHGTRGKKPE
ncbi:integrase catalytic domain-containing protein [Trichonephila clavata]|uniref:Integrase catalytic domain-containing protein n=1 Tax=Trichonephila clavata TaxID=2740835 RepID=A0A8X6IG23_TRICU|nr:integrase catalytic domain-containing protein [Trichonephila clavata]